MFDSKNITKRFLSLVLGVMACAIAPAWGQTVTRNKSGTVQVIVPTFVKITAATSDGLPLTIAVGDGGQALSYASTNFATFTVVSNASYTISGGGNGAAVPGYAGGPAGSTLKISSWSPPATQNAGTSSGTFRVTLSLASAYGGASPTAAPNTSGTVQLSVSIP